MSEIKLACEVAEQVKAICDKHGNLPGELINILHEAQHLQGYLPEEMQRLIEYPCIQSIWRSYFLYLLYHDTQRKISYLRLYGNCLLCTRLRKIIGRI